MPCAVDDGGSGGDAGVIQGDGPVAYHHILAGVGKGVVLAPVVVVFHAVPGVQLLHAVQGGDSAVDKDQVFALQDGGQGTQPVPDPGEGPAQALPQAGQVVPAVKAGFPGHLAQDTLRVGGKIDPEKALVPQVIFKETEDQPITVAADRENGVVLGQLQDIPQQAQTVRPFL